ncbi:universal stress protein [Hyphobacterium sp.]|uniref:universal stress protein n=1 Tax=Hyphobacterium sp. TaxID=2004662 RepID=UPI003B524AFC
MDRIITLIDGSAYTESVCDHAAWVAGKTGFGIDLLHVIDHRPGRAGPMNLSGNLTLGARSELLEKLTEHDEQGARLARERGRLVAEAAKSHLESKGTSDVKIRLRNGDLLEAVQEVEGDARVIVIGKRGEHADFAKLHLGSNLERVVRSAHRPVLVTSRAFRTPKSATIAFDTGPSVAKAVDHIAKGKLFAGMELRLLHVGAAKPDMVNALEAAAAKLRDAGYTAAFEIVDGEPEAVFTAKTDAGEIEFLVMGAYGHSRLRNLIIGSTTTQMIRACPVPVLLFRPDTVH